MNILSIGLFAVIVAASVLLLAVLKELAPAGGLTGRGRWYLAAGFGAGVIAFTAKLALIGWLSAKPATALHGWAEQAAPKSLAGLVLPANAITLSADPLGRAPSYVWQALPREAPGTLHDAQALARVELGRQLFNDKNLSQDRSVACASCHDLQTQAGADGQRTALGIGGQRGGRNAPTVWNAAFQARLFWDGRAASLEQQAKGPPVNPLEMGLPSLDAVVRRVEENPDYRRAFAQVFAGQGQAITIEQIAAAIAAYERTLITPDTPYDRFVRGDAQALTGQQLRGMALFEKTGCINCHNGPNFSAASLLGNDAAYRLFPGVPEGLDPALGLLEDSGAQPKGSKQALWRVPSLRNVALTAPYFHNGGVEKLEDAVRVMARAQLGYTVEPATRPGKTPYWLPAEKSTRLAEPRVLHGQDISDIAAFLQALSDDRLAAAQPGQARTKAARP